MQQEKPVCILTLSCSDTIGIVAAVTGFLADHQCNILESAQFDDRDTDLFFLRIEFAIHGGDSIDHLAQAFEAITERFSMQARFWDRAAVPKVVILASKFDHCAADLLYRCQHGELRMQVPAIISNHPDLEGLARRHDVPYHYLPVQASTREAQETRILELVHECGADFVVLARYMQILSDNLCRRLEGRAVNIHHSFLPGFKGAKPYHQAHRRGVKLIGATAHFVTTDLDEGPIIEQVVARVNHTDTPDDLIAAGRDSECLALAWAVKYLINRRVFINGNKTVIFP